MPRHHAEADRGARREPCSEGPPLGLGSADAAAGASALAERVLAGKPGYGDWKRVVALLARYAVQIAEAWRLEAMKQKQNS